MPEMLRKLNTLACLLLTLGLVACTASPDRHDPIPKQIAPDDPLATIRETIKEAEDLPSPQAEKRLISAANQLLDQNRLQDAAKILIPLDSTLLPASTRADHVLALARLAMIQEKYSRATALLTTDERGLISASTTLDAERLNRISLLRAQAWEAQHHYLAAARERIFVSPMLSDPDTFNANHQHIWADLTQLSETELEQQIHNAAVPEIQGWMELAWLHKSQMDNLDQQLADLRKWQQRFSTHPAARQLPDSLRMLTDLSNQKPRNIALLLPLQGKFRQSAIAIQNGFMTAHFAATAKRSSAATSPAIRLYDSTDTRQFMDVYRKAVAEGAEIVVGPLQKENVHQLTLNRGPLPVPTIALNTDDSSSETPSNLFQFGLSPEDDAREIALQARSRGLVHVAILYQSSPWGERAATAFSDAWQSQGGEIKVSTRFESSPQTLANTIKNLLQVNQSEARNRELRRVMGNEAEFEPHRRQDIDFIYLVASPEQARLIKPLLNFYYADDLPVYSGSQLFTGEADPAKDRDLDGILFCDVPWMLAEPDKLKRALLEAWPKSNPRYFRLNALGADAYRLQARLHMLTQTGNAGLSGATGNLQIGERNRIQRSLSWAIMHEGQPQPLSLVVEADSIENHEDTNTEKTGGESGGNAGKTVPGAERF